MLLTFPQSIDSNANEYGIRVIIITPIQDKSNRCNSQKALLSASSNRRGSIAKRGHVDSQTIRCSPCVNRFTAHQRMY